MFHKQSSETLHESDPDVSLNIHTPNNTSKPSVNLPRIDKKKDASTPHLDQTKNKKMVNKNQSKYTNKEIDNKDINNSGLLNNNDPLEINCIKKIPSHNINSNNTAENDQNNLPTNENNSLKYDRRTQAKTTRKRDNSTDTREASCTNRKNRDKSLYASHNTINPSDMYDDDISYLSQVNKTHKNENYYIDTTNLEEYQDINYSTVLKKIAFKEVKVSSNTV